jgi:energy-coupling factor transporter ATP-binding protein EcfA2
MGLPVLIIGPSGSGKSTSLRNFKNDEIGIVNVLGKPLPFRNDFKTVKTDDYAKLKQILLSAKTKSIVIDDAGYLLTNEFMRRSEEKGYDKFAEIAKHFWDLIHHIINILPADKIVYMTMHVEKNDAGDIKPKTIGRMLDEKVCIEGHFSIVLRALKTEKRYIFRTQTDGYDVTKTPMDMFQTDEIDNDLKIVDETIRKYYKMANEPKEETTNA